MTKTFTIPRVIITGPHRSAGKTTVSVGLCHAIARKGVKIQPFKKGPDYIDPMWLTKASGRKCRNLDFHMMGDENILRSFETAADGADIALIEGNQGLFDGMDLEGADSTAGLAHLLSSPVVFVMDTSRMNRGVAPILLGYSNFDPDLKISGVILNNVASPRHEAKLVKAIERYVGLKIIGAIPKAPDKMGVTERHLGLVPVLENPKLPEKISDIADIIEQKRRYRRYPRNRWRRPFPAKGKTVRAKNWLRRCEDWRCSGSSVYVLLPGKHRSAGSRRSGDCPLFTAYDQNLAES